MLLAAFHPGIVNLAMSSTTSSTGGPPPQQPPPGANGHRKSSSLNRGWFEGTMEVISGMAPRPVTPSQHHVRSASAPNSPARGLGMGLFGGGGRNSPHHHFPPHIDRTKSDGSSGGGGFNLPNFPINRLPSQDSLDRSIHNESGHGKSTAQIIRDLKHSNSALSAKMASLEKRHMNELAQVEAASSKKRQEIEQISAKQKMKLMQYEQYKAAAESKMKQQDTELSKVKEESAFQRHSISDLKNQLYQLQQELDERDEEQSMLDEENDDDGSDVRRPHSDDGRNLPLHPGNSRGNSGLVIAPSNSSMSTDDLQQMALDNEELVKEVQELQERLMEYQGYDKKLKDMQRQLEAAQKISSGSDVGIPPRPTTPTHIHIKSQPGPERERPPLAPSKSRDQDDHSVTSTDGYRKQLQDAKEELEAQTLKLYQHESSVRDLEAEKESLTEAHSRRVQELEDQFEMLERESKNRELALRKELTSVSQQEIDQIETRVREEQQAQVVELEEQLEQYAEKLAEVAATLAESRQQAKNQEQYRKDEAEDLRMIQDAHEAEIVRLEKELEESTKELELRDEELEEMKQKFSSVRQQEKEDEKKFEEAETEGPVDTIKKLEMELESLRKENKEVVSKLEMEKTALLNDLEAAREAQPDVQTGENTDSPNLHRYWEEKTSKTKEVGQLKNEIESMRQRVHESAEAEKLAEQNVQDLKIQLQKYQSEEKDSGSNESFEELKLAKTRAVELEEEISRLNSKIEDLNNISVENEGVKNDLQEAQTALVALDDDKQAMNDELNGLVSSLEKEKDIRNQMTARLESQEKELSELQDIRSRFKLLEAEKLRLQDEVENLKNSDNLGASGASTPAPHEIEGDKQNSERQIEELEEEKNLIKTKLKDRDTTIATLLRSSIVLENKIESLQGDVNKFKAQYDQTADELQELRSIQINREEELAKAVEEIKYLKGQLKIAKADAKRWKRALKEDGTPSGEYRYQIAMLQKANEDFADTVQERDQAIQNLVNQSMGQESHVRDLKIRISSLMKEVESVRRNKGRNEESVLRAEIDRLQEESEIFAGQIIEQDEEFKRMQRVLIRREEQIASMQTEIDGFNERNTIHDSTVLQDRNRQISELKGKIEALESQRSQNTVDPVEMKNLRAELDEMQEAADSNRVELRDLRQQLWKAKDAAGAASDLRVQLDQARWEFNEYKRNNSSENTVSETKLSDLQTELQGRETVIKELREQLSKVCSVSQESDSMDKDKNNDLESELHASQSEVSSLRERLESKAKEMEELSRTLTNDNQILCEELKSLGEKNTDLDHNIQVLTKENESLRRQNNDSFKDQSDSVTDQDVLKRKAEDLAIVNESLTSKNGFLVEKNKVLVDTIENLKDKNQILAKNGVRMEESIESLKADMDRLLQDSSKLEQLKMQLHEAGVRRESSEKAIIEKYEKELQSLSSSKDAEMDVLRNNLTESREKSSENVEEVIEQLKFVEEENKILRAQFESEMQAKDQQIYALEHTLHAQEQIVDTMRSEMDQIQSGMEYATKARRNEVEEMQQEVMQVEGKAMKQEREIVALKMQLEERKLEHKADVVKLKDALAKAMEHDSPLKQTMSDLHNNDRMLEVRERLEQLKARNTDLQEENLHLGGRLERAAIQIRTFEVEQQQAKEIEVENMKLRNQLKEYEQLLSRSTKSSRSAPISRTYSSSSDKDDGAKAKDKKKKKFGLFKRKNVDEFIAEGKEEEEC